MSATTDTRNRHWVVVHDAKVLDQRGHATLKSAEDRALQYADFCHQPVVVYEAVSIFTTPPAIRETIKRK